MKDHANSFDVFFFFYITKEIGRLEELEIKMEICCVSSSRYLILQVSFVILKMLLELILVIRCLNNVL